MKKAFSMSTLLLSVCLLAVPALAWDDVGHKLTGYIAWQRMSPAARENVVRILRFAPEDSHISAFYIPYGPKPEDLKKMEYFVTIPIWADLVRSRDGSNPIRSEKYHRGNWHYSDTYWRQENGKAVIITDSKGDGQGVVRLGEMEAKMRDPKATDAEKAVAIAWFLHIGGDLHQPLHTSGRHTDREPKGDQGGNFFQLTPEGTKREDQLNLHWFWDSIIGRNVPYFHGLCESDYIRGVAETMMLRYPYASASSGLMLGKYEDWQKESFLLATTEVFRSDLKRFEMPPDAYRRNAYNVAEQRLTMAGYRMGDTLNEIFGK